MRGVAVGAFWTVLQTGLGIVVVYLVERKVTTEDLLSVFVIALGGTGLFVILTHLPIWRRAESGGTGSSSVSGNFAGGDQLVNRVLSLINIHVGDMSVGVSKERVDRRKAIRRAADRQQPERQPLQISFYPSSGNSESLTLGIRNDGAEALQFMADCRVFDRRDTGSEKRGTYKMRWDDGQSTRYLHVGETGNLLVALFEIDPEQGRFVSRSGDGPMGRVTLPAFGPDPYHRKENWDDAMWLMKPRQNLPVFGLAITVTSQKGGTPQTRYYRLQPAKYSGPLELVERTDESL